MASLADELAKLSAEMPEEAAVANWTEGTAPRARRPSKEINASEEAEKFKAMSDVFREFDADGSRSIDEKELSAAVAKLGIHMDNASLLAMHREADADSNGTIDFEEFEAIVNKASSKLGVVIKKKQEGGAPLAFASGKRGNGIAVSADGLLLEADGPVGQSVQLITVGGGEPTEDDTGDCWLSDNTRVGADVAEIMLQVDCARTLTGKRRHADRPLAPHHPVPSAGREAREPRGLLHRRRRLELLLRRVGGRAERREEGREARRRLPRQGRHAVREGERLLLVLRAALEQRRRHGLHLPLHHLHHT